MTSPMRSSELKKVTITVTKYKKAFLSSSILTGQTACTLIVPSEIKYNQSAMSKINCTSNALAKISLHDLG